MTEETPPLIHDPVTKPASSKGVMFIVNNYEAQRKCIGKNDFMESKAQVVSLGLLIFSKFYQ